MGKRLLIVVDMQNDFIDGALGFPGAEAVIEPIRAKIAAYRAAGDAVAFTMDTHGAGYLSGEEGTHLPVEHCLKPEGDPQPGHPCGWGLAPAIDSERLSIDEVFEKPTFPSLELGNWLAGLREKGAALESIELVGLVSNICVLSNAVIAKAACPNARIIVDARCTASFDPELHEKCLDVLAGIHVEVVNRVRHEG